MRMVSRFVRNDGVVGVFIFRRYLLTKGGGYACFNDGGLIVIFDD